MAIQKYKPTTPTRRFATSADFSEITASKPYRPLTIAIRMTGGRNNHGHITSRHRGGGHKRRIRLVDFKRLKVGVEGTVRSIEYDPNRSARIALIQYADGQKSYILAPSGLKVADKVMSGPDAEIKVGNHMPIKLIPAGTPVHNIEMIPGQGAKLVRAAGGVAQILSKESRFAHIKLPSGEVRMISIQCSATIGQCSNINHENISYGKAGRFRWLGIRPQTRGVAMNPVDHPLGGGEGKTSGGRIPCSPTGVPKGLKTRSKGKMSNKFIVKARPRRK